MALERERRSIGWEREDDEKRAKEATKGLQGLGIGAGETEDPSTEAERLREAVRLAMLKSEEKVEKKSVEKKVEEKPSRPKVPSTALMGCSMLGSTSSSSPSSLFRSDARLVRPDLDGMYKHSDFQGVQLHTFVPSFSFLPLDLRDQPVPLHTVSRPALVNVRPLSFSSPTPSPVTTRTALRRGRSRGGGTSYSRELTSSCSRRR
jgi:hypothetical protein